MPKVKLTKSEQKALDIIENEAQRKAQRREILKTKRANIDLSKYVKGTALYARAAQMKYGLASLREIKIKEQQKFSRAIKEIPKENPIEYFNQFTALINEKNKAISLASKRNKDITSGTWVENKEVTFKENYISALKQIKVDDRIRKAVDNLSPDEIRFVMPDITQYYVPNEKHRIKNGKKHHLNVEMVDSDSEEDIILERLSTVMPSEEYEALVKDITESRKKGNN